MAARPTLLLIAVAVGASLPIAAADAAADDLRIRLEADVAALRARLDREAPAPLADPDVRPIAFEPLTPAPDDTADLGVADEALEVPGETAGAGDFDTRLRALEERFSREGQPLTDRFRLFGDRLDALDATTAKFITGGAPGAGARLFGRLHADYHGFPRTDAAATRFEGEDPQDRFLFRRVRLGVKGDVGTNMFYKLETEVASADHLLFRDAFFGFRDLPAVQSVVIGNQKRPYGLDALNSSRFNVFIERPAVVEAFNGPIRRLGVASYGVSDDLRYNWRYGAWNLDTLRADGTQVGDGLRWQAAGRLATTYWWDEPSEGRGYGHFAVSGTLADPDARGARRDGNVARFRARPELRTGDRWLDTGVLPGTRRFGLLGVEHVLNYGPFQWTSEALALRTARDDGGEATFGGAYTYVSWVLTGEHHPWSRESGTLGRLEPFEDFFLVNAGDGGVGGGWGAWEIAARYSHLDLSDDDVTGGEADNLTLGLNWYWNANAGMQVNYVRGRIAGSSVGNGAGGAGPPIDSDYDLLGVRFRLDF